MLNRGHVIGPCEGARYSQGLRGADGENRNGGDRVAEYMIGGFVSL